MNILKFAVVACSLFASAAYAQNAASASGVPQQVAQTAAQQAVAAPAHHDVAKPAQNDECVGPAGFCIAYFGS
ncbi:MAG: hypothetical protein EPN59_14165 [Paraburkholderia sp.]|uniref:hypothetical protein n=1 Tax=Paraburkholderia sp. TaxID=1926495 RepID=UPI0011FF90CE|nr:hypothetical protein [Paraburkholderia sp.]TAM28846.1 MAG: hypothetical protein EPN59_14165 [Paraburkholderia sp.]